MLYAINRFHIAMYGKIGNAFILQISYSFKRLDCRLAWFVIYLLCRIKLNKPTIKPIYNIRLMLLTFCVGGTYMWINLDVSQWIFFQLVLLRFTLLRSWLPCIVCNAKCYRENVYYRLAYSAFKELLQLKKYESSQLVNI